MAELVLKEEVYEIIGAAMEVYYQLGRGFLEPRCCFAVDQKPDTALGRRIGKFGIAVVAHALGIGEVRVLAISGPLLRCRG